MKITDLTENDAVHCATRKEFERIYELLPNRQFNFRNVFEKPVNTHVVYKNGDLSTIQRAKNHQINIIPSEQITDTVEATANNEVVFKPKIHDWFELSYAQYLTIPRSALQSMPDVWQEVFTAHLEELDSAIDWRPENGRYWVRLRDENGRYVSDPLQDYQRGRRVIPFVDGYAPASSESKLLTEAVEILNKSEPWPLRNILSKLVEASEILLHDKNYDGHGWENISVCADLAKRYVIEIESFLSKNNKP